MFFGPHASERDKMETHKTEQAQRAHEEERTKEKPRVDDKPSSGTSIDAPKKGSAKKSPRENNVRKLRTERMMSKAELARRAGLSTLTIDRVEKGMPCRMDTKRKILEALGLTPSDRVAVFGEED